MVSFYESALQTELFHSLFTEAWQVIETDPLVDSDEEVGDEYVREDCSTL